MENIWNWYELRRRDSTPNYLRFGVLAKRNRYTANLDTAWVSNPVQCPVSLKIAAQYKQHNHSVEVMYNYFLYLQMYWNKKNYSIYIDLYLFIGQDLRLRQYNKINIAFKITIKSRLKQHAMILIRNVKFTFKFLL